MDDYTEITTKFCHPMMNFGGDEQGCNDVTLKLPKTEVMKLQSSVVSDSPQSLNIDYQVASQYWGIAFSTVIALWLFSKGIGAIINMVRNA